MANKQIKDLNLIGSNIDAASDFLIIQKADGSTYKVTVDQLINSSTTVSYGSSTGAPTVISEDWVDGVDKTITVTNMFDTTSAGVLNMRVSQRETFGTDQLVNHVITKVAGLNIISFGGQSITVGGSEIQIQSGLTVPAHGQRRKLLMHVSCTKNSLIIRTQRGIQKCGLTGQISIVPS
jgi:hypothetical protein